MKKTTTISIQNNGLSMNFDLETSSQKSDSKIQKALVYRFLDYYDVMRSVKAKGFKATEPFNIKIVSGGKLLIDTTDEVVFTATMRATLKLINTPKGRVTFEGRLSQFIALAIRVSTLTTPEEITKDAQERLLVDAKSILTAK